MPLQGSYAARPLNAPRAPLGRRRVQTLCGAPFPACERRMRARAGRAGCEAVSMPASWKVLYTRQSAPYSQLRAPLSPATAPGSEARAVQRKSPRGLRSRGSVARVRQTRPSSKCTRSPQPSAGQEPGAGFAPRSACRRPRCRRGKEGLGTGQATWVLNDGSYLGRLGHRTLPVPVRARAAAAATPGDPRARPAGHRAPGSGHGPARPLT